MNNFSETNWKINEEDRDKAIKNYINSLSKRELCGLIFDIIYCETASIKEECNNNFSHIDLRKYIKRKGKDYIKEYYEKM